ncbi:MAG: radical SAM protein [Tissierellia bacterium]|nr:radical SAM protein [Tissierellia bacterium]
MAKKKYIIPIFIPHLGCPNDCVFCNQRVITKQNEIVDRKYVQKEIDKYLNYFPQDVKSIEVAFYGGSFTGLKRNLIIEYLDSVNDYIKNGIVESIRLSTRPDYIDIDIADLLKSYNVKTVELGVQSMVDDVLRANNRGNCALDVLDSFKILREYNFDIGLQMMTGLYKSSLEDDLYTANSLADLRPDFVRIYPTMILPDTYLYELYNNGEYNPMKLDEMIDHVKKIVMIFEGNNINITRIGLPDIQDESDDIPNMIGPYHPALRQIIYSEIYFEAISNYLIYFQNRRKLTLYANNSNISYLSGYKSMNRDRIYKIIKSKPSFRTKDLRDGLVEIEDKEIIDINKYCLNKIRGIT